MAKNKKKKNNVQKPSQNPAVEAEINEVETVNEAEKVEEVKAQKEPQKAEKPAKKQKQAKAKPTAKERGQSKVKETVAELKKVTWPTFPKVVKNTLLVLGIVLLFTIVLFGIDFGLSQLYKLLTPAA